MSWRLATLASRRASRAARAARPDAEDVGEARCEEQTLLLLLLLLLHQRHWSGMRTMLACVPACKPVHAWTSVLPHTRSNPPPHFLSTLSTSRGSAPGLVSATAAAAGGAAPRCRRHLLCWPPQPLFPHRRWQQVQQVQRLAAWLGLLAATGETTHTLPAAARQQRMLEPLPRHAQALPRRRRSPMAAPSTSRRCSRHCRPSRRRRRRRRAPWRRHVRSTRRLSVLQRRRRTASRCRAVLCRPAHGRVRPGWGGGCRSTGKGCAPHRMLLLHVSFWCPPRHHHTPLLL